MRRRAAFWKHAKIIGNPCVSARTSCDDRKQFLRSANSFPKCFKIIGKSSKTTISGCANGYGPFRVCLPWHRGSCWPHCRNIENHWGMKGSARVLAPFLSHALPSANGFPDPQTVSLNPSKTIGKQSKINDFGSADCYDSWRTAPALTLRGWPAPLVPTSGSFCGRSSSSIPSMDPRRRGYARPVAVGK